jgi:hypothetical protein
MTEISGSNSGIIRRRNLLPTWIKVFLWIFIVLGGFAFVGLILGLFGVNYELSLYGLETNTPFSPIGICLIVLFFYKFFVAFNLWKETDDAILYAKVDAYIGIALCLFIMFVYPFFNYNGKFVLSLRLELAALIPYLIKLNRITADWKRLEVA